MDKAHAWYEHEGKPIIKDRKPKFASDKAIEAAQEEESAGDKRDVSKNNSPRATQSEHSQLLNKDNSRTSQPVFPSPNEDNPRPSQPVFPSPDEDTPGSPYHDRHSQHPSVYSMLPHQGAIPLTSHQSHPPNESSYSGAFPLISGMPFLGLSANSSHTWPQYP